MCLLALAGCEGSAAVPGDAGPDGARGDGSWSAVVELGACAVERAVAPTRVAPLVYAPCDGPGDVGACLELLPPAGRPYVVPRVRETIAPFEGVPRPFAFQLSVPEGPARAFGVADFGGQTAAVLGVCAGAEVDLGREGLVVRVGSTLASVGYDGRLHVPPQALAAPPTSVVPFAGGVAARVDGTWQTVTAAGAAPVGLAGATGELAVAAGGFVVEQPTVSGTSLHWVDEAGARPLDRSRPLARVVRIAVWGDDVVWVETDGTDGGMWSSPALENTHRLVIARLSAPGPRLEVRHELRLGRGAPPDVFVADGWVWGVRDPRAFVRIETGQTSQLGEGAADPPLVLRPLRVDGREAVVFGARGDAPPTVFAVDLPD